jgi:hypothetical protein
LFQGELSVEEAGWDSNETNNTIIQM